MIYGDVNFNYKPRKKKKKKSYNCKIAIRFNVIFEKEFIEQTDLENKVEEWELEIINKINDHFYNSNDFWDIDGDYAEEISKNKYSVNITPCFLADFTIIKDDGESKEKVAEWASKIGKELKDFAKTIDGFKLINGEYAEEN